MKILHIIDDLEMGGGQNLLIGLAGGQVKRGYSVTILQLKKSKDKTVTDKIQLLGGVVKWLTEDGALYNPMLFLKLIPWIRRADVVHVHLFPALYWAGFAKLFSFCKTPIIYTEHSTKNRRRSHLILRNVDLFVYNYCYNQIIACSMKALETFKQVYPNIKHICAINNGVNTVLYSDAKPYTKQELLGISEDCFVVTMVARFMPMKRQDTVVESIAKLPKCFHAVFVGGEEKDEGLIRVKEMAIKLGVAERVHFLFIRSDVPRILKTSDVVMMASDYEGLSLSSIEGMAAGKPFVATNVDGLREVVQGAGLLFENNDNEALARVLQRLYTNKGYYEDIVQKCSDRAKCYDLNGMVDKYLYIYQSFSKN